MRKPKGDTPTILKKWADQLRTEAFYLEQQAFLLRKAADTLLKDLPPEKETLSEFKDLAKGILVGPPSTRDRDGDAVIHP